jgi:uncharacterized heparinase superfamily protein
VAHALLGQNVMVTPSLSFADRKQVLHFAASFLWADFEVADSERRFLTELAQELEVNQTPEEIAGLLASPPTPEDVDPMTVPAAAADLVRRTALRAIAADGFVSNEEMSMFELLDDLLPKPAATSAGAAQ